jgi:hypothetical protein
MAEIVQIELSEDIAKQAREVARRTGKRLEEVLRIWIKQAAENAPVDTLPDDQVLALADMMMSEREQREMSKFLEAQREGRLSQAHQARLDTLLSLYRQGMVRKSEALRVAVARGLRPPID